ncbi:hypothetical protein SAY87_018407 [Trapa incisa]|uniref:Tic22-like family protein n=1 Tax=Trapa incisa TaxID=236973 RepID=A0AAN7QW61_9MYRT|nr:hypothetical protein SAY87_018407 [Trapa incisa]
MGWLPESSPPPDVQRRRLPSALPRLPVSTFLSLLPMHKATPLPLAAPSRVSLPLRFDSPTHSDSVQPKSAASVQEHSESRPSSAFPSTMRIAGLNSSVKGGGPAFVGQVFSMCDLSGTGLMAVSTHFDIPFLSSRTPEWLKKLFATIKKSERNGPVFRFFMDLGDAVTYVKRLNIPSGVVGACRLDLAYEHFKEKPHLFQFIPNEKQVKAANKLLRTMPHAGGCRRVDGVPVFSAQNLDIAIATSDGIKWYTPYFFDKNMLDNILEESVDQHFQSMIQTRHMHRRRDVIDDSLPAEVIEDNRDSLWEPPEVQEVLDEIGHPGIPLSVISKAAEVQLFYAVDRVILGNRWLRKVTGIQPRFPYIVDSFEKRSLVSSLRASKLLENSLSPNSSPGVISEKGHELGSVAQENQRQGWDSPFSDWFRHPWLEDHPNGSEMRGLAKQKMEPNPFLPKITMVGISTGEAGQMTKSNLKKTMEDLTRELEQSDHGNIDKPEGSSGNDDESKVEERDPLFVANVGDYYSGLSKPGSTRWILGRGN